MIIDSEPLEQAHKYVNKFGNRLYSSIKNFSITIKCILL